MLIKPIYMMMINYFVHFFCRWPSSCAKSCPCRYWWNFINFMSIAQCCNNQNKTIFMSLSFSIILSRVIAKVCLNWCCYRLMNIEYKTIITTILHYKLSFLISLPRLEVYVSIDDKVQKPYRSCKIMRWWGECEQQHVRIAKCTTSYFTEVQDVPTICETRTTMYAKPVKIVSNDISKELIYLKF